jgi:EAL domain-containing protein (putative c-di-GMP-specific phosphodiesterase class I)
LESIGLEVTAEGIECPEQLAVLLDQPSMYLQRYLLARLAPADEILAVISAGGYGASETWVHGER